MTAGLIFSIPSLCAFSCFISFMFNYYVRNANKTQLTSKTRATHRCSRHLQDLSRRFDEDPIQVLSSHNRPMPNINMRCSFISTSTLFCWNPSRKYLLILNKPHFWPWKNIYSANQFSHKSTRDAHQTLGFSLILAAPKIQRFQVASKNLPCRFGSFSRMWKLKKKMLATKPSPTLFHEAQCYCWKKKLSNSIKEVRIPSDSCWQLVYPQSNRHASFDCWNTTSRKFIACRTTSWELGFPIAKSFAGSRNLIQIRAEHEAGLHSLSESPFTWMNLNPNQQDSMLHKPLNVLDFVRMPRPSKNTKFSNINTKTIKNCTTTSWWFEKETYQTYLHNQLVLSIASSMLQPFKSFT